MQTFESIIVYLGTQIDYVWKKVTSRKFLLALAGAAVAYINGQWELLQGVLIAYLAAEGLDDFVPVLKTVDFKQLFSKKGAVKETAASEEQPLRGEAAAISPTETKNEVKQVVPIPFDKEAFMSRVENRVIQDYGIRNACTLFYEAQFVFNSWSFNNQQAWEDAKDFLSYLAGAAFKEVWGESYDEALVNIKKPDAQGCTYPNLEYKAMQLGMAYYAVLLEYKRTKAL